jgi:axial budding pattern protein 2
MRLSFLLLFAIVGIGGALSQSFNASQPPVLQDPYVSLSFASQLNEKNPLAVLSGAFPQTSGLDSPAALVPSGWSFSIGFQPTTFNSSTARLSELFYWAALPNFSQLPDWLEFENDTLTFSGVAPKYAETPSNSLYNAAFVITVFSSLISGQTEGAASTLFILEIAGEVWTVVQTLPPIVTVAQGNVASRLVPALMDAIRVNERPLENFKDISMVVDTSETPWLRWDRFVRII